MQLGHLQGYLVGFNPLTTVTNSLALTYAEGMISTVSVNKVQKHSYRLLWWVVQSVAKGLQGSGHFYFSKDVLHQVRQNLFYSTPKIA